MKLYATITSERASKSQGGNEYLIIDLMVGSAKESEQVGQVELYLYDDDKQHGCTENEWKLQWRTGNSEDDNEWTIFATGHTPSKTKGKKQKGETDTCFKCGFIGLLKEVEPHDCV